MSPIIVGTSWLGVSECYMCIPKLSQDFDNQPPPADCILSPLRIIKPYQQQEFPFLLHTNFSALQLKYVVCSVVGYYRPVLVSHCSGFIYIAIMEGPNKKKFKEKGDLFIVHVWLETTIEEKSECYELKKISLHNMKQRDLNEASV